jgi:predicted dehydrogenase
MGSPFKVGIIGAGVITSIAHRNVFVRYPGKFEVVGICDTDKERACELGGNLPGEGIAYYTDYTCLLADPEVEVVLVAVPPFLAAGIAVEVLEAGKHLVLEKPMGDTAAEALKVLEASRRSPGKMIVAEQFFFAPAYMELYRIAHENAWPFGPPELVELRVFWKMTPRTIPQFYHSPWRHDRRLKHGYLIEGGCHTVNLLRELFGMPEGIQSRMMSVDPALGQYDTLLANCVLGKTTACQITMTYGIEKPGRRSETLLHSERGTIDASEWEKLTYVSAEGERTEIPCPLEVPDTQHAIWFHFHDLLSGKVARNAFGPDQSYGDIDFMQRLIDAAVTDVPPRRQAGS